MKEMIEIQLYSSQQDIFEFLWVGQGLKASYKGLPATLLPCELELKQWTVEFTGLATEATSQVEFRQLGRGSLFQVYFSL